EVRVVEQPVDGGGGEGLGHDGVEPGRVDVAGDRDRAALVGGIDDAVEGLGGVLAGWQHADVIDGDQVAAADPGDGAGDGGVGLGSADRGGEGFQGEPGDPQVLVDRGMGEGLGEVAPACSGREVDRLQQLGAV